jgi:hypothetical protein
LLSGAAPGEEIGDKISAAQPSPIKPPMIAERRVGLFMVAAPNGASASVRSEPDQEHRSVKGFIANLSVTVKFTSSLLQSGTPRRAAEMRRCGHSCANTLRAESIAGPLNHDSPPRTTTETYLSGVAMQRKVAAAVLVPFLVFNSNGLRMLCPRFFSSLSGGVDAAAT